MRKAALFMTALAIAAGVMIALFSIFGGEKNGKGDRLKVAASFYPLAHFAEKTGGEDVEVSMITPPGAESHDFEPTPRDIRRVRQSALFIYNGAGLDPWAQRIAPSMRESGVRTLEMTSRFTLLSSVDGVAHEEDGHGHEAKGGDPHIWLDPLMAAEEVLLIAEELAAVDTARAAAYRSRSAAYAGLLEGLHKEFEEGLSDCATREMIVAHDAFSYLARRYRLEMIPVIGVFSGEEPSPRRMAEVARLAREKSIKYIFFEPLTSPRIAETIARETGAGVLELNPLEGLTREEALSGKDYISIMRSNLANIKKALRCK